MKVKWTIDEYILESETLVGDIKQAVLDSGAELHVTKYVPFQDHQDYGPWKDFDDCVILYGTHGWLRRCERAFTPGAYGITNNMNCSVYYSNIPVKWMLNGQDLIFLPYGYVKNNIERVFKRFKKGFFLRPDSGFKTFPGTIVTPSNFDDEFNSTMKFSSVHEQTMCVLAPLVDLHGEYRFVVGANEVIDGSQYRYNNILDIRHDWPKEAWKLAEKMSKHEWQPDTVYTCDVAMTNKGPKIIEINSFACAGLYATDKNLVVRRINEIALNEFNGDY